ncbi:MAG: cytosine permease [Limisphaerales bacterium]
MSSIPSGLAANAPDVEADMAQSRLCNADLAPVPRSARKWGALSFAALWISMAACIPTYMLASSLISGGMNWWQAVLTIFSRTLSC